MSAKFVSNKDETVPLFKNPVLEYFSHIHPLTPVITFTPAILYTFYLGLIHLSWISIVVSFALGLFIWTLTEYSIHRWAFHYHPKSGWGQKLHFLVHGIHHDYPRDSTRLVMPIPVSIPLAVMFYFTFRSIFGVYTNTLFSGFILGYVIYDSIHYATHHFPMRNGIAKWLKDYHIRHHFEDDATAYGVSNPLWDFVFNTVPAYIREKKEKNIVAEPK
jgi:sterol desaturase/sphingolipid hydroxylase (fatty acid hydroxylase superfamily)